MTVATELQRLFAMANSEGKARAERTGCVDRLHHVQAARAALSRLDAPSLRDSPEATRLALGQGSSQ
ncbi:hypothetical protein [Pedococcus sp. 5OH_020]|uniref:hypothetical protein n=1 Tax=Pedococcus sp. 5OH_020 TaxID=2989814 RepID=UPI0022EA0FA8|nr:hypothetical protein [Pedococcus sp. 5OH_020]